METTGNLMQENNSSYMQSLSRISDKIVTNSFLLQELLYKEKQQGIKEIENNKYFGINENEKRD